MLAHTTITGQIGGENGGQNGGQFDPSGGFNPNGLNQSPTDTLERGPFRVILVNTATLDTMTYQLDSTIRYIHQVQPLYKNNFLPLNLGPENGLHLSRFYHEKDHGVSLGYHLYDDLEKTLEDQGVKEVNRSFWQMHYGQGLRPERNALSGAFRPVKKSTTFNTRFYTAFKRNINLNFNYQSLNDNYPAEVNQVVGIKNLDFKLSQRSKKNKRFTFANFKQFSFDEGVRQVDRSYALNRKNLIFDIGNKLVLDSINTVRSPYLISHLTVDNSSFQSNSDAQNAETASQFDYLEDTLAVRTKLNKISFSNEYIQPITQGKYSVGLTFDHLRSERDTILSQNYFQAILKGGLEYQLNDKLNLQLDSRIGLLDAANYYANALHLKYDFSNHLAFDGSLQLNQRLPTLEESLIYINATPIQEIELNPVGHKEVVAQLYYEPTKSKTSFSLSQFDNYIFLNAVGRFQQRLAPISLFKFEAHQVLDIGFLKTAHHVKFQKATSTIFSLPEWQYKGSAYVNFNLFKNRMKVQMGVDGYFIRSFDAPEFFPATGTFYNQELNTPSGNIIILNPYLSAKVDQFYFFIKGISFEDFITSSTSFVTNFPRYPYSFRLGIKWTLMD